MGKKQKQTENGLQIKKKLWVVLSGCVWANHWLLLEVNYDQLFYEVEICSPIVAAYEKVINQIFATWLGQLREKATQWLVSAGI